MRKIYFVGFLSLLLLICSPGGYAQEATWDISGTVTDANGNPMGGAVVWVQDTSIGATANATGEFSLKVPPYSTLTVSFLGYETQEFTVTGPQELNVVLQEEGIAINEIVVTALGIKRERKALGYAMGEVDGDELTKAKETNVVNSLAGKIPGLVVSQTAGGPAGSTSVMLRGATEISGNNQPLYVVDGIPLDNTNFATADQWGGYDLGDGISTINPDDIENISVLKGPAASALYGSRASHGVILITTKKAGERKGLGIEFNSTTTVERQLTKYNDIQAVYGQGFNGVVTGINDKGSTNHSWGPKIDPGMKLTYFDGTVRPFKYIKNNIDGFFKTGVTTTNSVIISHVKEDIGVRLSYTNLYNTDIVPNSDMQRNSINLRGNGKVGRKVDFDAKISYVREDVKNRPMLAEGRTNVGKNLITLANTYDQAWLKKNYKNPDGTYFDWNNMNEYNINPYWMVNEMLNTSAKDKFSGMASFNYKISEKFSARVTGGADVNFMTFRDYAPQTTPGKYTGYLQQMGFKNYNYNVEALIFYKDKWGKFDFGANIGGNIFHVDNKTEIITATEEYTSHLQTWTNFAKVENQENVYRKQINSLMAMANVGFDGYLYLDATIRMDESSTLPRENRIYYYPSVSASFVFSEIWNVNRDIIPYAKLRASFAQVGSDTDPYQLYPQYQMSPKSDGTYSFGSIYNNTVPNQELKPTRTNSMEFGLEMRFLRSRMGLDVTYYNQRSRDQIMDVDVSHGGGYAYMRINAGIVDNKGIEISLNTRPVQVGDFSWDLNLNFSKNSNKIVELYPGIEKKTLNSMSYLGISVDAVVGQNFGSLRGRDYIRNSQGQILINPETGYPEISANEVILGNASWDWTGGITTTFRYKTLTLSAVFDIKVGGDLYSGTARSMVNTGKDKRTVAGREAWYRSEEQRFAAGKLEKEWTPTGGLVAPGVVAVTDANGNVTYEKNTKMIDPQKYWSYVSENFPGEFIYDNTYVKIREITLTYDLPQRWTRKFAEHMSVSFVARNPLIIYKNVPNIDPDSNYNSSMGLGLESGSLPSRRSFGFNINIKF